MNQTKICTKCKIEKPATTEYFYKKSTNKDNLNSWCKNCQQAHDKEKYDANKDILHKKQQAYYWKNRDKRLKSSEQYRKNNPDKLKLWNNSYFHKPESRLRQYKKNAKDRNLDFLLTKEQFTAFVFDECFYCGRVNTPFNGIDRIDSTKGYTIQNCVTCCAQCNWSKSDFTQKQFFEMCSLVTKKHHL